MTPGPRREVSLPVPRSEPVLGGAAIVVKRCNPYGHETGGPRQLLGGLYGPEYEGRIKWTCKNPATVRARMTCEFLHRGQVMDLCLPHAREIQKRQAGLCPKCAWPPEALMWHEAIERLQNELAVIAAAGDYLLRSPAAVRVKRRIEGAGHRMTELYHSGVIRKTPLTLTEVS